MQSSPVDLFVSISLLGQNQYSLSKSGKTAPRAIKSSISGLSKNSSPTVNANAK